MLLPSQKPAKAFFLVFAFKISLRHQSFLVDAPTPKENPGSTLHLLPAYSCMTWNTSLNNLILWSRLWLDTQLFLNVYLDINSTNMSSSKELNLMLFCIAK